MKIERLHRDEIPLGGFAGLKEHRLVVDTRLGGGGDTWNGIGNFVYLADARFLPHGDTHLHSHKEIDVISVMVEGRIEHEGSLEHGKGLSANQVQVQRAGSEGFSHNEINPDPTLNHMIQLWVLPENPDTCAAYKCYDIDLGKLTQVYGGDTNQNATFDSHTIVEVGRFEAGETLEKQMPFMAYVTRGAGELNDEAVRAGDLVRGEALTFTATETDTQIIVISES